MRVRYAAHRASRLFLIGNLVALSLAACTSQPSGDQEQHERSRSSDLALAACQRADVQDVVGKETRGKLFKAELPRLTMQEWMGYDSSRAIADFDNAVVRFTQVSVDKPEALGEPPYRQIVCKGHIQIDMSNATVGQQIASIDGLRWVINISGQPSDPATDAFTVDVDDYSIQDGLKINGRSPAQPQQQEQADQGGSDAGDAGLTDADRAARDAAQAADEAQAAVAQAEAEMKSAPQAPTQQRNTTNQPSEDDLYAPH